MIKYVIKRDGRKKEFLWDRIKQAIKNAYVEVYKNEDKFKEEYNFLQPMIENELYKLGKEEVEVEEIQDVVVSNLIKVNKHVGDSYQKYREKRTLERSHPIDKIILELIQNKNEFLAKENSNKQPELASTQRDLMAGTISRHLSRKILPENIVKAMDEGLLKMHDADYLINPITNCELLNLEDMFQNGTVINGKMIETPKSLQTAMTLATQIVVQTTSNTYGGCSISLSHIAPFVRVSKNKIKEKVLLENKINNKIETEEEVNNIVKLRLDDEIKSAVQTLNYQINTMSGQNGQTAFLSVFIYLNENKEYTEELALLAKEIFKQRIEGMKDEHGIKTTQTFPKLLYVLDENNIHKDSEYYWLTKLAMQSTALRQAPDYQSAKVMKELYGDVFPCINKACA